MSTRRPRSSTVIRFFHRDFKLRTEKADVPVIPVYATRRTCASPLVTLDVHPRGAMAVVRHSRIAMTMEVYSQVSSHAPSGPREKPS